MLRSQSISNLSDQRKSKTTGFLNSLKSRKLSSKDLKSQLRNNNQTTNTERSSRPLTSGMGSSNLLHKDSSTNETSPTKGDYRSTVARERGAGISNNLDNKENFNPPISSFKSKSGSSASSINEDYQPPSRTLRTRSSAPNLKGSSSKLNESTNGQSSSSPIANETYSPSLSSKASKRNSTFFGFNNYTSSSSTFLPSSPSLINILSDEETIADSNSPYTPPNVNLKPDSSSNSDSLMDESPILIQSFEFSCISDDEYDDTVVEDDQELAPKSKSNLTSKRSHYKKLHRTTNILNLSDFIKSIDHNNNEIIPINNRKSLEFEKSECTKIKLNLQKSISEKEPSKIDLNLVENVMFLSINTDYLQDYQNGSYEDTAYKLDNWYDQDYIDIIKNDDSDDDEYYMDL